MDLGSMRLINVNAFIEREKVKDEGKANHQTEVLKSTYDETAPYAILSHRWAEQEEVDYEEIVDLEKMEKKKQDKVRQRLGCKKILASCE